MSTAAGSNRRDRGNGPGLGTVVIEDLRRAKPGQILEELRQLYLFYLDEESRRELASMGRVRRAILLLGWTAKSMLMKLSPARRIMILLGLILTLAGWTSFRLGTI